MTTQPTTQTQTNDIEALNPTGMFVWWTLDETKITPDNLRAILADENFDPASKVPDIEPSSGISRACAEWRQGRGKSNRYRAEVTYNDGMVTTVGLLTRRQIGSKEVEWTQVGTAEFIRGSGWTLITDAPEHDDAMVSFKEVADERMTYLDHRWIRPNIITSTMTSCNAVSMCKGSGFYFVPKAHIEEIRKLRRVVRRLGNSHLRIAVVGNDRDTVDSVSESARDALMGGLAEVREQLTAWSDSERKIRTDSQANLLGELGELVALAETYEAALGVTLGDLRSEIAAARRKALEIIADKG